VTVAVRTKECTRCIVEKPLEEFYVNRYSSTGRTAMCKACESAEVQAKAREKLRIICHSKELFPCEDCGGYFSHYKMQFDHVPCRGRADKTNTWNSWTWERILKEMDKCDLVCGNCHLARTWQRRENRLIL